MKHFTEEHDLTILKEVLANPPFDIEHGKLGATWDSIAEKVSETIKRTVKPRSLKDRLGVLIKTFKQKEAASSAASGISEVVSEKDILLRECVDLMEAPKFAKPKVPTQECDSRELGLKRLREKSEPSECNDSEQSAMETKEAKSHAGKRNNNSTRLADVLGEYVASTNLASEEKLSLKKSELDLERMKLEFEQEKFRKEIELRARQQQADLESQKRRDEKEKVMMDLFLTFVPKKDGS